MASQPHSPPLRRTRLPTLPSRLQSDKTVYEEIADGKDEVRQGLERHLTHCRCCYSAGSSVLPRRCALQGQPSSHPAASPPPPTPRPQVDLGGRTINARAYCSWYNFKGADQQKKVGNLSGKRRRAGRGGATRWRQVGPHAQLCGVSGVWGVQVGTLPDQTSRAAAAACRRGAQPPPPGQDAQAGGGAGPCAGAGRNGGQCW